MKVDFGICTYANPRGLDLALSSIAPLSARALVIHIPYLGFDLRDSDSLDLSIEVLKRYPNTVLIHQSEAITESEARNKYLETTDADFLIVMDDDETIERYNADRFAKELVETKEMMGDNPFTFTINYIQQNGVLSYIPRLFYLPNKLRYTESHNHVMVYDKYRLAHNSKNVKGLTMRHQRPQDVGRLKEFEKSMDRYAIWQKFNEKQY